MAFRDLMPWKGRKSARKNDPFEIMRGVVEPMEHFFESPWSAVKSGLNRPRVELEETPAEFVVTAKLPGMSREDVKVDVTDNTLTLRGSRTSAQEKRRHGMLRRSESAESFVRRFSLPAEIKTEGVKASFKGETLEIRLPRAVPTQVRAIDIE